MGEKEDADAMVYFRTPLRKSIHKTSGKECGLMSWMKTATDVVGRQGEDIAESYLRTKHFQIRERNVRFGRFEIDIVAYDPREKMIVFIEVKSRSHNDLRYPIRTAVDQRKRRALQQGIYRWVLHHKYEGSARIDLIFIAEGQLFEHIVNIGAVFY